LYHYTAGEEANAMKLDPNALMGLLKDKGQFDASDLVSAAEGFDTYGVGLYKLNDVDMYA
jgi:hypothetical protein